MICVACDIGQHPYTEHYVRYADSRHADDITECPCKECKE